MDQLMTVDGANKTSAVQLILRSQIEQLQLVPPWIEALAVEHMIPTDIQYAMNLCLEEILSNIIRHGYGGNPDHKIVVRYVPADKFSVLVIDDEAPHFNPLTIDQRPIEETLDGTRIGGLGIRLVRGFATIVEYEPTPSGNRLTIGFGSAQ
jgi:serine/threonine-protein kinase RsbW